MGKSHVFSFIVVFSICILLSSSLYLKAEEVEEGTLEEVATYVCPMGHYESTEPGECPECGMMLVQKKKDVYRCPMCDYESHEPGECPECGMILEKMEEPEEIEPHPEEGHHEMEGHIHEH